MLKVIPPDIRDKFKIGKNVELKYFIDSQTTIFNKVFFITLLSMLLLVFRTSHAIALSTGLAFIAYLIYWYFKIKQIANCVVIKRIVPQKAREFEEIEFFYEITNRSYFKLEDLILFDDFDGTLKKIEPEIIPQKIRSSSKIIYKKKYLLDGGMGLKKIGPLNLMISDPLNFFSFKIQDEDIVEIPIYPKIEKIPYSPFKGDLNAIAYGLFEVPKRGETTNFIGTREYRQGDPIKHINWKLSLKGKKIIVNEFEKNVNTTITIFLNIERSFHLGKASHSTWEYCKDLALGIATSQIEKGNTLQLITNFKKVAPGQGQNHINFLELLLSRLELNEDPHFENFISSNVAFIPQGSVVFFVSPIVNHRHLNSLLHELFLLDSAGLELHLFLVDGTPYTQKIMDSDFRLTFLEIHKSTQEIIKNLKEKVKNSKIKLHLFTVDPNVPFEDKIRANFNPKKLVNR